MAIHIFANNGHESSIIAVEADSEIEARGIMQKKTATGISPKYRGTFDELEEDNFVFLTRL